ncbi:MAG TPA: putative baseplate assembly protein, partial [Bryobacteraceae bacterium]|nr:putative baseplate assembly protein [Bryobacteraceae bacterium]
DASYPGLAPSPGGEPQWVVFDSPATSALCNVVSTAETGPVRYTLTSKTTQLTLANGQALVNHLLAAAELNFLTAWEQYAAAVATGTNVSAALDVMLAALSALIAALGPVTPDELLNAIVAATRSATVYLQRELLPPAGPPLKGPWSGDAKWRRQDSLLIPVEGPALDIAGGQTLSAGQPVTVSGKRLRLQVSDGGSASFVPRGESGALNVSNGQIFLVEAFPPANAGDNDVWQTTSLSGVEGTLTVSAGNVLLLASGKDDAVCSESAVLSHVSVAGATTTLSFAQALGRIYDRSTVTVNANTVAATHGETVHEIAGSGDATNPALQFTLKQSPLTYVSSSSAPGAQSTLQVRVNNLQWRETDNFLSSQAADRVFITRRDPKGNTIVQFGDGVQGSRPPTGQMNIRAAYRRGIGAAGMVAAGQLSQALDRPQGLKSVTNPDPATGGADPDSADDARISAPLHVLTLDRVVSLEDYQNFARAFAGIAKALATWTWFGKTRGVFLTVAGAAGSTFEQGDPAIVNLIQALRNSGNPFVPLRVASFTP